MNVSLVMVAANACGGFSGEHKACHIRKPWSMERGAFLILLSSVWGTFDCGVLVAGVRGRKLESQPTHTSLSPWVMSSGVDISVLYLLTSVSSWFGTQGEVWMPGYLVEDQWPENSCYILLGYCLACRQILDPGESNWQKFLCRKFNECAF